MANRPNHIDIPDYLDPLERPLYTSHSNLTPPQSGSIPPALSPLDAFAFQGRLLARRFEQESSSGKRLSRLPPLTIQNEFAKTRPSFFRSASHDTLSPIELSSPEDGTPRSATEVKPEKRPMSTHPLIQSSSDTGVPGIALARGGNFHNALSSVDETREEIVEKPHTVLEQSYFPFPRSNSPEVLDDASVYSNQPYPSESTSSSNNGPLPSFALPVRPSRTPGLAAPSTMVALGGSPSIRSVIEESNSDDVDNLSLGGSVDSWGVPKTPASPFRHQMPRSPSLTSERSFGSTGLPRPSFNYSRPLSRTRGPSFDTRRWVDSPNRQDSSTSTRPSLDVPPFRQDSGDSPLTPLTDLPQTPVSVSSGDFFGFEGPASDPHQPSSYTYAKYALPRGKAPKRESMGVEEFFNRNSALINWDFNTNDQGVLDASQIRPDDLPSPALTNTPPRRRKERPSDIAIPRPSEETQSSPRTRRSHKSGPSSPTTTTSDASTIKARLARSKELSGEITPEMHLEKGIICHEAGSLQESTYHFRLAAKAGLSDAMLLYALACRHGWGMRPSPGDAVMWLRKAVDCAQLEVAEDEQTAKAGKHLDVIEKAKHRAQFALGAYELGISYMKGWGVQQDKALALRCFEVAGSWGDADALAEAGFCYAEGIGAKKDLKKAAKFYRAAEAKGMSMAGNSWIHKEKYKDVESKSRGSSERPGRLDRRGTADSSSTSKKRDKSRTRNFFGRKKSSAS